MILGFILAQFIGLLVGLFFCFKPEKSKEDLEMEYLMDEEMSNR